MNKANLKRVLKERGFTQESFAEKIGISHSALKNYISGKVSPPVHVVINMSEVLDCSLPYLLEDSEPPFLEKKYVDLYTVLLDLGFRVIYNPENEDQIKIAYTETIVETTMSELTTKVKEFLQFEIYRLSKEQEI